jgi:DNA polymerase III sliding clamp (beta) subunit (PCNA family)
MHITVEREHLLALLEKAVGVAPARAGAKFLSIVWISAAESVAGDGPVCVEATDGRVEYVGQCAADVISPGRVGSGRHLFDLIRRLPPGPLELQADESGQKLHVRSGRRKYNLPVHDPSWYAPMSAPKGELSGAPAGLIRDLLGHTLFCASQDADGDAMHLVHVDLAPAANKDKTIRSWALDGHKAAVFTQPWPDEPEIVSQDLEEVTAGRTGFARPHVQTLLKLLPKSCSDRVEWAIDNNRLYLQAGEADEHRLSIPVQSQQPPDLDLLLEKSSGEHLVHVRTDLLLEALDRISVFISEHQRCVKLYFHKDTQNDFLELRISSSDRGDASERVVLDGCSAVPHELDGLTMPVAAWQTVIKQLRSDFEAETIGMVFSHRAGPVTHRPGTGNAWRDNMMVLLMPMIADAEETYYE